jgi:hypothetical protein
MVMESFSIVLDMVIFETYSSNKQTSKRHWSHVGIPCSSSFALGGGSIADFGPLTNISTYH